MTKFPIGFCFRFCRFLFFTTQISTVLLFAQNPPPAFTPFEQIPVLRTVNNNGDTLALAWAGGLQNPHFSEADLNHDGINDLLVFDKASNQTLPFLRTTTTGTPQYVFSPQHADNFPELRGWVLLLDYNGDTIVDLFTYNNAGIAVYRGSWQDNGHLTFELANPQLRYMGTSGIVNILANQEDLPAFADVNNDGDVDILNFDFGGSRVEYFENQSQELTTTAGDTLWFLRQTKCWGMFSENVQNNSLFLNDDCGGRYLNSNSNGSPNSLSTMDKLLLHTGSTLLAWDLDGDADQDLIIGDVAHPNLILASNTGTTTEAFIGQSDTLFPSLDVPVNIHLFPAAFRADVSGDGLPDLLVSPNDRRPQTQHLVWYYQNVGTPQMPLLQWQQSDFLERDILDVGTRSYPAFVDADADGLCDLLVGNLGGYFPTSDAYVGTISFYKNTGTQQEPVFSFVTSDFGGLSQHQLKGIFPHFFDLDADGDLDLLAGDESGAVHFFRNIASAGQAMLLQVGQFNLLNLSNGDAAVPCIHINQQTGLPDVIVGENLGKISYFQNTTPFGSEQLSFELNNEQWGGVDVRQVGSPYGYAAPVIAKLDTTNQDYLLVMSESGKLFAYTDLEQSVFTLVENYAPLLQRRGGRGGIALADLNENASLEMAVGNIRGGLSLYSQPAGSIPVFDTPVPKPFLETMAFQYDELSGTLTIHLPQILGSDALYIGLWDLYGHLVWQAYRVLNGNHAPILHIEMPPTLPKGMYVAKLTGNNFWGAGKVLCR